MKFVIAVFAFMCLTFGAHCNVLTFLELPRHDGVQRVCQLTSTNFTNVVNSAEIAVVIFTKTQSESNNNDCPTELSNFAELTAQVLRKKNILVCTAPEKDQTLDNTGTQFAHGDVYIYKKGSGKPYYGERSVTAVLGFLNQVNNTQVNEITGKVDKIAFDANQQVKVVGFFMRGTADYLAFEEAASLLSPSVAFYTVFDRVVAQHLKLKIIGEINLVKPMSKTPSVCPQNPASSADIVAFVGENKGALLTKIDKHNLYDPQLLDPTKLLVLAIGEQLSPSGGYFYHLITRLVRNNTNNTEFLKLNVVWIEPQIFPTIYLMMEELESTLGLPNKLPAFGFINVTSLQSAWLNTSTFNVSADKLAVENNLLVLQDFLAGVINNTVVPVKLGKQAFVVTPSSQALEDGVEAVLECVVENPCGECLWLKDGRNLGSNLKRYVHYSWRGDQTTGDCSLVISGVKIGRDDGEWICEVTGDVDTPTLTSPPAKIVVSAPSTASQPQKEEL